MNSPKQPSPERLVLIAKITRPHGLDGCVRIQSFACSEDSFLSSGSVYIRPEGKDYYFEYRVLDIRPHKNVYLLRLEGVGSRTQAESLRGASIFVDKRNLKKEEGEYFWFEILGMKVYLQDGKYIGTVKNIMETGSNDVFVIRRGEKEILIPAIEDVIRNIDLKEGKIIVELLEGMGEIYEI